MPEWKKVKCMRQSCAPLNVLLLNWHWLPFASAWTAVTVIFVPPKTAAVDSLRLSAPVSFRFGERDEACKVTAHDMAPYLRSCRVDADVNSVVLEFSPPLSSVTFHDS